MAAKAFIQPGLSDEILNQFNKKPNSFTLYSSNGIFPANDLTNIITQVCQIQFQLKISDKLNNISLISSDKIEILFVVYCKLS